MKTDHVGIVLQLLKIWQHNIVAVIMPNVYRSFYMDETNGLPYWTYLTEELMPELRRMLPLRHCVNKTCHR